MYICVALVYNNKHGDYHMHTIYEHTLLINSVYYNKRIHSICICILSYGIYA